MVEGRYFFLIYKSRSGSTYLSELLSRHPEIGITLESNFIPVLWHWADQKNKQLTNLESLAKCLEVLYEDPKFSLWRIEKQSLFAELSTLLPLNLGDVCKFVIRGFCQVHYPQSRVYGLQKGGWYVKNVSILRALIPDARVIHLIRDGRAIFASSKIAVHSERGNFFETDVVSSTLKWTDFLDATKPYQNRDFYFEVRYEDLIQTSQVTLGKITEYLGVSHDTKHIEALLEPQVPQLINHKINHLHQNLGKGPMISRINAWQEELHPDEIKTFEQIARSYLLGHGYSLIHPVTTRGKVIGIIKKYLFLSRSFISRVIGKISKNKY